MSTIRLSFCLAVLIQGNLFAQDISHRQSQLTLKVEDSRGNTASDATVNVRMVKHAFQFGSQIRDRLYTMTQGEFDSLSDTQKQVLLASANTTFTPDWNDVLTYRARVNENFNHVIPTNGMQWVLYNNDGPGNPQAAISRAQAEGMTVTGHAVVWGNDNWPTPNEFRPGSNPDPTVFHNTLVEQRLSSNGIMARFSDSGVGPTVTDWDVLNEPINERHYTDTFQSGGIYNNVDEARTDFFVRADQIRPDATLAINEYNIISSGGDGNARNYRDAINAMLDLGAPIDVVKIQAHMARNVSRADIDRRLDIIAETGLPIVISEFDMRDDSGQISEANQKILFEDMLRAAFEHPSVEGFNMWGFWDAAHWRGNGPLYNDDWTVKDEAQAWFDLVHGDWKTTLNGLSLDGDGTWIGDVVDGTYEFDVTLDGVTQTFSSYQLTGDDSFVLRFSAVPEPSCLILFFAGALPVMARRRRSPTPQAIHANSSAGPNPFR